MAACLVLAAVGRAGLWGYRKVRARPAPPEPKRPPVPRPVGATHGELQHINDVIAWDLLRIVVAQTDPRAPLGNRELPAAARAFAIRSDAYAAHNALVAAHGEAAVAARLRSDEATEARVAEFGEDLLDHLSVLLRRDAADLWNSVPPAVQYQQWLAPLRRARQMPPRRPVTQGRAQGFRPTVSNPDIGKPPMEQEYDPRVGKWVLKPRPILPVNPPMPTWPK